MLAQTFRPLTTLLFFLTCVGAAGLACAEETSAGDDPVASEDAAVASGAAEDQAVLRFIGERVAASLAELAFEPEEADVVADGFRAGLRGEPSELDPADSQVKLEAFLIARQGTAAAAEREASAEFLAEYAAQPDAVVSESGLVYIETQAGEGDAPGPDSQVKVHYHGTLRDGRVFDSSVERGEPSAFPLNRVISCWQEGVVKMRVGGKATLICPSTIAYGDRGSPPLIAAGAALKFDVELLEVVSP